ncbi:secreted frizzled-related protein 2-like [Anolis carolinensis]|uniref:secreted frizzled-related protein 2-like n=1 Tax=Anolis carolinensis TaxID=28377 RepID=UPI002F2B5B35
MLPAAFILIFALHPTVGFDISLSTKCVAIPKELYQCHDISSSEMRLPNLMGHTSLEEVVVKFAGWETLVQTGCHPHARTFFCSLFAPICMDIFILPCRSMCLAIRESCTPVRSCQGHPWPSNLNCDRFPTDEDSCLPSLTKESKPFPRVFPTATCQDCPEIEEFSANKRAINSICANSFAVKVKLSRNQLIFKVQEHNIDCQVKFLNQGLLLSSEACSAMKQWLLINENCTQQMSQACHAMAYLIVGAIQQSSVLVNRVYCWPRQDSHLSLATWKWRHHKCL